MFNWLKGKTTPQPQPKPLEIRDTLFGDAPLHQWASAQKTASALEPWASFGRAQQFLGSGDTQNAIASLQGVLKMPELESRQYLQAYHCLRSLGVDPPPEKAKDVLGVVVEVGIKNGVDLVAAWADHHARYYNFSGAGVVWERPDDRLDPAIDDLLRAGEVVARVIGPWDKERPPAPPEGMARINMLVPSGLHFGQGALDSLSKDRLGGPVIASALRLMQELISLGKK